MEKPRDAVMRAAQWMIALISAAIGGVFGVFGEIYGILAGGASGFLLGYFFVPVLLSLKNEYVLAVVFARVLAGTAYGAVAGILSGMAVYAPGLLMAEKYYLLGSPGDAMGQGGLVGLVVGAPFGFALSLLISVAAALRGEARGGEPEPGKATEKTGP